MIKYYCYNIVPLPGREEMRRFFWKSVAEKNDIYNNRRVTLNERFSLIERGFKLSPIFSEEDPECCTFQVREVLLKETSMAKEKPVLREHFENIK
ncbi:unnamed protein product [Enterobius vermicularis]|uniref:HTH_OrfB_IS605 domain-containing protein n=1 Tax=Enterobius vermicularis TaxID=51028 RepID=A0A158Q9J2_ENTVE|nr:unnamed protein product [Enterobius vermicularis]